MLCGVTSDANVFSVLYFRVSWILVVSCVGNWYMHQHCTREVFSDTLYSVVGFVPLGGWRKAMLKETNYGCGISKLPKPMTLGTLKWIIRTGHQNRTNRTTSTRCWLTRIRVTFCSTFQNHSCSWLNFIFNFSNHSSKSRLSYFLLASFTIWLWLFHLTYFLPIFSFLSFVSLLLLPHSLCISIDFFSSLWVGPTRTQWTLLIIVYSSSLVHQY